MSELDSAQASPKRRKDRPTRKQNDSIRPTAPQRLANDNKDVWKALWKQQGQTWRTEPEIDADRQKYLAERRTLQPDVERSRYPFGGIKLSRADIEWLLATHENGRGPVDWNDERQRERKGLDLRGADMRQVDLSNLPLACLCGGLAAFEWDQNELSEHQRNVAGIHLERANLREAMLQGSAFYRAHLEGAELYQAQLQQAKFRSAYLKDSYLRGANLEGAYLVSTNLEGAYLIRANLKGTRLERANLERADLRECKFGDEKCIGPCMADIHWGGVNLAVVNWASVKILGDEYEASQRKKRDGTIKDRQIQINEYQTAVRANRQLATVLQDQGLNELADHFAYRAQLLQRKVWQRQRKPLKYIFSWLLYLLAGYGYRPLRSLLWYLTIIVGFALAYFAFGNISPLEAFVLSLTSFHGRGFFPGTNLSLSDPRVVLAAFEAVAGLLIEISFIATFTRRFFGR